MNFSIQRIAERPFSVSVLRAGGAIVLALGLVACNEDSPSVADVTPVAPPSQVVTCKDYDGNAVQVKPKTVTVYNNSAGDTIYPVVATSKNLVNEWIQGCLRTAEPYPTKLVYKLYVNEGKGIPPNSSVTVTLPLYSELAAGSYITWWNGGRVVLADRNDRLQDDKEDTKLATPDGVTCQGQNTACTLSTYSSNIQFPENIYAQLSEYTFGDSIIPAGQSLRLLKPENVGYNISYVDHVYMPVAIGPKNNPYIGYSGSAQPLVEFRNLLKTFLNAPAVGEGWPVYNLYQTKLPGGYNIFAQRDGVLHATDDVPIKPTGANPPVLTVMQCINGGCSNEQMKTLRYGQAVQRMQNLWGYCAGGWDAEDISTYVNEDVSAICPAALTTNLTAVKDFFKQSHQNYLAMYARGECEGTTPKVPVFNYWQAITHIYGWVPFNEGCGAAANPLAKTTIPGWDHAAIQSMYIHQLQYNHQQAAVKANPKLLFNPYVGLIHDDLKMNAYGFSVDDAVGFMSELGDGLIFAVGGTQGLENSKQFSYADGFTLMVGVPASLDGRANKPLIKKYGVCVLGQDAGDMNCEKDKQDVVLPDNSQIAGFRVGTVAKYPIKVRFTDVDDNVYSLRVNEQFQTCPDGIPLKDCPPNKATLVDKTTCRVVNSKGDTHANSEKWCVGANPNQQKDVLEQQLTKNFLSYPQPVNFM
ncbi:hypothetical protein [Eoetvoesiella caeni]|uniref:Uncharacterized protein n=1 Tax=Eoetvoesiella caeni TaxID=645616 RepID=A0A366H7W1_9BURK|nr:hypothetical protein [Eoetvoesiella caeni]MCI2809870.1 hypothetical protein [Eoetvoesiella caeni]NYT56213.1 hypothetical protein [Eoetvoesiella caeni]RBP38271.1 hypothetical protein DFR37_10735 [Eoetvoesiella caeni]